MFASASRDELGAALGRRRAPRAARRAASGCSAAHAGARSKNVRCCRPNSRPMPRAVVCGRSSPPAAASSSTSSRISRNSSGPALLCASPNVTGRSGAPVDLGHPVHSRRACLRSSSPGRSNRGATSYTPLPCRPSTSAIASSSRSSAHVPGTGRPSGTRCSSVRDVEKPSAPARHRLVDEVAHRRDVVVGRRRLVEAALAHRVVAHRAVPDHAADVDALRHAVDRARGTRRRSPSPRRALEDARRPGCPRPTPSARRASDSWPGRTGANVTPQLPSTTDVTPCQHDDVASGSHASCASRCVWMSTKPGVT